MKMQGDKKQRHTEVLIVGGSLVGLSTAMFLAWHGVSTLNVEKHKGTAIHPRAGHFHLRTLEAFRSVNIEQAVQAASLEQFPPDGGINAMESLAGREIAAYISNLNDGVGAYSPTVRLFLTQQKLEPILQKHAQSLGSDMNYSSELISFEQNSGGVIAQVRDVDSGDLTEIHAKYLVAADGNRSPVREHLGIAMKGYGLLSKSMTIYFRAPVCAELLLGRNLGVIYILNDQLRGFFRFEKGWKTGFLVVMSLGDATRPGALDASANLSFERCKELVRSAIGQSDAAVEVIDVAPWLAIADVAERYREDRVFLIGDAAHVVPPTGGFGGNTGIQDAHNLAWKLAMVIKGSAGDALLDSYSAERQPVGAATIEQAYVRYVKRVTPHLDSPSLPPLLDELTAEIGYRYTSDAIVADETSSTNMFLNPRQSGTGPGSRAGHVVLHSKGKKISTLDLFGRNFVLLTGAKGNAWCAAAKQVSRDAELPFDAFRIAGDGDLADPEQAFLKTYELSDAGAVIVRPDGFVGWRSYGASDDARLSLLKALASLTFRNLNVVASVA